MAASQRMLSKIMLALLVAGGGLLVVFGMYFLVQGAQSYGFEQAQGTIVSVLVKRDSSHGRASGSMQRRYFAEVTYRYTVDGRSYTGKRYSLGQGNRYGDRYPTGEEARTAVMDLTTGSAIAVYFDPWNPQQAVLRPGIDWGTAVPLVLGIVFLSIAIWLIRSGNGLRKPSVSR